MSRLGLPVSRTSGTGKCDGKGWAVEAFTMSRASTPDQFKVAGAACGRRRPCVYPNRALCPRNLEELSGTLKEFPGYFASVGFAPRRERRHGGERPVSSGQGMFVSSGVGGLGIPRGGERIDETHRRNDWCCSARETLGGGLWSGCSEGPSFGRAWYVIGGSAVFLTNAFLHQFRHGPRHHLADDPGARRSEGRAVE
jgi:hypothetical protein